MNYWILLLLAIIAEITGTLSMKYASLTGNIGGHMIMYIMIAGSYILLSFVIRRVALSVAYALWEGIGLLLITLFSALLFGEGITLMKICGMALLLTGIMLVKSGTDSGEETSGQECGDHATS